jgi:hypothetical protein
MTKKIRKTFDPQEDVSLVRLIMEYSVNDWGLIARNMPHGFTARQCRERWKNYLDPRLKHTSWTEEDDRRLMQEFDRLGAKWIPLARMFPGRSGNSVRNRVFLLSRKKEREPKNRSFPIPILSGISQASDSGPKSPLQSLLSLCEESELDDGDPDSWIRLLYSAN